MSFEFRRERVGGDIERSFVFVLLLARERSRDDVVDDVAIILDCVLLLFLPDGSDSSLT